MDKVSIAVASGDGKVVNVHFGKARKFYIYELEDDKFTFKELREYTPACSGEGHDDDKLRENLKNISDCDYLVIAKIGDRAATLAENEGIVPYEIPGDIEESLEQLNKFLKVKELFN